MLWVHGCYQSHGCQQGRFKPQVGEILSQVDFNSIVFFFKRFYLYIHERHREKERQTQAEGKAGSMQGT